MKSISLLPLSIPCHSAELLAIPRLITLKGNHDDWFDEFCKNDFHPYFWTYGGKSTLVSYLDHAGRLTIMDIDTKQFWQSDPLPELYDQNFRDETPHE